MPTTADRVRGLLLGGAVGDALGAPFEVARLAEIRSTLGEQAIAEIEPPGHFTDDTQMTLFTCEALLISGAALEETGLCHPPSDLHHAYLRWLVTQGRPLPPTSFAEGEPLGWLLDVELLHRVEAPEATCLAALESGIAGTVGTPLNDSKGSGGVMRAGPAGFLVPGMPPGGFPEEAYHLGMEVAAVTHGHPEGVHSAGALAAIISRLFAGATVAEATMSALELTTPEVAERLSVALTMGATGPPAPQEIESRLGGGWVGEEALAIAVACAVAPGSLSTSLLAAVNHSGDTASTGAICGNILGALKGAAAIPERWLTALDGTSVVSAMAEDCVRWLEFCAGTRTALEPRWRSRYAPR